MTTDRMQLALRKLEDATYPTEPKPRRSVGQWFKRELASMAHDHVAAGQQMVVQRKAKPVDRVIEPWTQIRRKSRFHQLVWREITDTSPCGFLRAIVWVIPVLFVIGLLAGCATDRIEVDPEVVAAHELVGFDWCSPAERHQCALIRQGGELMQMGHPSRIGGGSMNLTTF